MNYNIKIDDGKHKAGYLRGRVDNFYWYALVHKEQNETGINPLNLQSGEGRVTRLCVYKDVVEHGGNPYAPSSSVKRFIYANYKREWDVLNSNHVELVKQLINYLERRYSLRIIK
ncbi:hypothetical protein [Marinisporobacter balticus]|uniref:Uncharacterized protein n=1 Tax=Marinisporobacter balticus TaxID=2018667 RepID=A0A4R2KDW2_9FIRM|nr:hypothetical protein [Marinisporobacter balticus]TCO68486.1 hypothetical protein EV214_1448 [Marinisporobacter balticus]